MKDSVYVELSVISYCDAKNSPHALAAGRQQKTRKWWTMAEQELAMYSSDLVRREISRGDPNEVQRRLALITRLSELTTTIAAEEIASGLLIAHAIPQEAADDALHIAIAAAHGMQFLVSWNFKHVLNALKQESIKSVIQARGFRPPILCTPEQFDLGD